MYQWNAKDYAQHSSGQERWAHELLDTVELQPGDAVLDVGCGDGRITALIAERVPQGSVLGIDLSEDMVRHAHQQYGAKFGGRFRTRQMDAAALNFDPQFNVVFSNATLHWVRDQQAALAGICRALVPGGRFIAQMGGHGNASTMVAAHDTVMIRQQWRGHFADFKSTYNYPHPDDYRQWLFAVGLEVLELALVPKDMVHADRTALAGWLRTAWHPYVDWAPPGERSEYIEQVVSAFVAQSPPDGAGRIHVPMMRLQVKATKPA